jgi:carboxyl-terminal processing protease
VTLPSPIDMKEVGESALEAALPWDRIPGVPFRTDRRASQAEIPSLAMEEGARAQTDPDYRWLVADIAAIDTLREQRSVSLNLKVRQEERVRQDRERLQRENARRSAKSMPALKTIEELEAAEAPDIMLTQAAEVMADMVKGPAPAMPASTPPVKPNGRRST